MGRICYITGGALTAVIITSRQRAKQHDTALDKVERIYDGGRAVRDLTFHMDRNVRENFLPSDWSRVVNRATCSVN